MGAQQVDYERGGAGRCSVRRGDEAAGDPWGRPRGLREQELRFSLWRPFQRRGCSPLLQGAVSDKQTVSNKHALVRQLLCGHQVQAARQPTLFHKRQHGAELLPDQPGACTRACTCAHGDWPGHLFLASVPLNRQRCYPSLRVCTDIAWQCDGGSLAIILTGTLGTLETGGTKDLLVIFSTPC